MRLLILTQYFPPEMGAPQARLFELGKELRDSGWEVYVLTAMPNYPTGRIFPGYRGKMAAEEEFDGIKIRRTWLVPSNSKKVLPRLVSYLSFMVFCCIFGKVHSTRPDLLWVESPPIFLGLAAILLSGLFRIPYVLNVSDLWPDSFVHMGMLTRASMPYKMMKALEIACYARSAGVTGQSNGIIDVVLETSPGVSTQLVTNGVRCKRFGSSFRSDFLRSELGWKDKTVFVYAGLHGLAQGLDQILKVAARLKNRTDIHFALFGDGPVKKDLMDNAKREALGNVSFHDSVSRDQIPVVLASSDVALITLGSDIFGAVPSKIYEAMASERPILLVAEGEAAARVIEAGAGITVCCGDIEGLLSGVIRMAGDQAMREELGAAGRVAAEGRYSREKIAATLSEFLGKKAKINNSSRQPGAKRRSEKKNG